MERDIAFSKVVLPEPVPPEIRMLSRERAAICSKRAIAPTNSVGVPSLSSVMALLWKLADRNRAAVEHERRQHDVDPAAVGEARIDHRARLVDAAADRGGDALSDADEMLGVAKAGAGLLELAVPLDKDRERAVDQYVGDVVVFEERFERSQPDHVVGQLGGERRFLELVELDALLGRDFADQLGSLRPATLRAACGRPPMGRSAPSAPCGCAPSDRSARPDRRSALGACSPGIEDEHRLRLGSSTMRRPKPDVIISPTSTIGAVRAPGPRSRPRARRSLRANLPRWPRPPCPTSRRGEQLRLKRDHALRPQS